MQQAIISLCGTIMTMLHVYNITILILLSTYIVTAKLIIAINAEAANSRQQKYFTFIKFRRGLIKALASFYNSMYM